MRAMGLSPMKSMIEVDDGDRPETTEIGNEG